MHDANSMLAVVQEVRSPSVVDRDASELRQDPDRLECCLTSTGIDMIVRQRRRTGDMHPVSFARNGQAGFILMDDFGFLQHLFDLVLDGSQLSGTAFDQLTHRAFAHLHPQQVAHDLAGTGQLACQVCGQDMIIKPTGRS